MIESILLFAAAAAAPAPPLQQPVKQDVECFILYAIGVGAAKDDRTKQGASIGLMYFFTKLKMEAPSVDLVDAVRGVANTLPNDPSLKSVGEACDSEFQQRGSELMDIGQKLQNSLPSLRTT